MKFNRRAKAHWEGGGEEGIGALSTQSGVLDNNMYEFKTRFKDKKGTNPEELIGAALSGCYTMQLAFFLEAEGHTAETLDTDAKVTFEDGSITTIYLDLSGKVPGMSEVKFKELATKAKNECPVSKLLKAEIILDAKLTN